MMSPNWWMSGGRSRCAKVISFRPGRGQIALVCVFGSCLSVVAQFSARDIPPGSIYRGDTNVVIAETSKTEGTRHLVSYDGQADEGASAGSVPVAEAIPTAAAAAAPLFNFAASPVIAGYLPEKDTNVAIGVVYPSGSVDFMYVIAGSPRPGDPRLPSTAEPNVVVVDPGPQVIFERAAGGSGAVMTRSVPAEVIFDYPPGTSLRGTGMAMASGFAPSSERLPPGAVGFREVTFSESGEALVRNFPPGAKIVRPAPVAPGEK